VLRWGESVPIKFASVAPGGGIEIADSGAASRSPVGNYSKIDAAGLGGQVGNPVDGATAGRKLSQVRAFAIRGDCS
jgi:hypothetical protein